MNAEVSKYRVAICRCDLLPISETFIRDQALALRQWHPILVGLSRVHDGLPLSDLETRTIAPPFFRLTKAFDRLRFRMNRPVPRLVATLKSLDVSLVHTHFGTDATVLWPSVRATGLPMLVTLHGYDINTHREWWQSGSADARWKSYPRRLLQMARHPRVRFIAVSAAIKERAATFGIPEEKIVVSYTGVDVERFRPGGVAIADRRRRILFVGRMVEKKAPLLLIRAFAETRRVVPDAELALVGGGPLLREAKRLAAELGLPVEFLGSSSSEEVLAQMHRSRVFCLPSITAPNGDAEGFGMVLLEAQACGVPVVTSARGGATEGIVEGETGFSFPEGDMTSLANNLVTMLSDDVLCARMSIAAVKFVEAHFDSRKLARALEATYDRSLGHHEQIEAKNDL